MAIMAIMPINTQYMGIMVLVILIFIGIGIIVVRKTTEKEGFQAGRYKANTPNIQFCPPWAPEVQTAKGFTDCCQGEFLDGKCQGTTWCTQSPTREGVESCLTKWKKYYAEKSKTECPRTMPHYYGNPRNSKDMAGCSAAPVRDDGAFSQNTNEKKCRIYPDAQSNMTRADSCYLEKGRIQVKCPRIVGVDSTSKIQADPRGTFQYFACSLVDSARTWMPSVCIEDKTGTAFFDRTSPNWRRGESGQDRLDSFCSNANAIRLRLLARRAAEVAERKRREALERAAAANRKAREAADRRSRDALNRQRDLERQLAELRKKCRR